MRNLMLFHGSCGHTTVNEVPAETWERFAKRARNRTRTGRDTRMVYVEPDRFCICQDCMTEQPQGE